MKKSRFSEHKIINILKEGEAGRSPKEIIREYAKPTLWLNDGLRL